MGGGSFGVGFGGGVFGISQTLIPLVHDLFDTITALEILENRMTERGTIHSGGVVLDEPIDLPEGTEVLVHIEPVLRQAGSPPTAGDEFHYLPFFGMWADRDDVRDSIAWVRRERDKWQERLTQQR